MSKPILCLDFDGVIHSYVTGWKGADVVSDPPVPGAIDFIRAAVEKFRVSIYSSRSGQNGGITAMQDWLHHHLKCCEPGMSSSDADALFSLIEWPGEKPPAMVTIDDRAITFTGEWPALTDLLSFKPWNKR